MGISLLRWVDTHPVPFLFPRLHVEFIATAPPASIVAFEIN